MKKFKIVLSLIMMVCVAVSCVSCGPGGEDTPTPMPVATVNPTADDNYVNTVEYVDSAVNAVDDLGRVVTSANDAPDARDGKYVGLFYFLWIGEHPVGSSNIGPFDNSVISAVEGATKSEENWLAAGGGPLYAQHYWGQPLFGYYKSSDEWVMRKHVQMLTDADIDFLFFDTTNGITYSDNALKLMSILDEYYQAGWDVPRVVFYTNTPDSETPSHTSGSTINEIYSTIYAAHPEYSHLWFNWDGKPLIIGDEKDPVLREDAKEFFRIKANQWPNEDKKADGFPWMEFSRSLTDEAVYGVDGEKEVVNVSVAQHNVTVTFSYTAWYRAGDSTRSYHDGENDKSDDAVLYGYNFAEQFEWALDVDPEIITITGWNEWVAQRQPAYVDSKPIVFVDCADINTSRDIEPMQGGYGDNYYMQMISYIRQFKGTDGNAERNAITIDINGGFAQWNDVAAYYRDYTGDTADRNSGGFGSNNDDKKTKKELWYTDESGRNDIEEMKVTEDSENVYFFVKTVDNIIEPDGGNWMNLFISDLSYTGWNGFNYVLNYKTPENGKMSLGKLADGDDYSVTPVSEVSFRLKDNMLMVEIPKADLGIEGDACINFKWADNCTEGDVFGFYTSGDAAPIGRAGYYYGYNK